MQKRLFNEAKTNPIFNEAEDEDIKEGKVEETAEYKFTHVEEAERFFIYITDDFAEDRNFTAAFVDELIAYIMAEPEYRLK